MNFWQTLPQSFSVLAPMEGVTDLVFRQVIAKASRPDVFFTEFTNVSSFASEKGRQNALERLEITSTDAPIVAQIWGKNPAHFAELSSALDKIGFQGLDINMGCPDRHVNRAGGGAAMIRTPELAAECINQAKSATKLPVSVKTRLGFTYPEEYQTWLPFLLKQNLAALTVHLRTRKEMSKVPAHYELIPDIIKIRNQVAKQTKLIINGDIKNLSEINQLHQTYSEIDGFMIGRGVFQNPYCFTKHTPTPNELKELFLYHLDLHDQRQSQLEKAGSRYPYEPLKHFFKIYINSFNGASELRAKLMDCKNTTELRQVLTESML